MTKRILVIANESADGDRLQAAVGGPGDGETQVLLVAPALGPGLFRCIRRLTVRGFRAEATIGDADPVHAAVDALELFPADELVLATNGEHGSNRIVERLAELFDGPILHVVVGSGEPVLAAA
jgi:hypothetical protein